MCSQLCLVWTSPVLVQTYRRLLRQLGYRHWQQQHDSTRYANPRGFSAPRLKDITVTSAKISTTENKQKTIPHCENITYIIFSIIASACMHCSFQSQPTYQIRAAHFSSIGRNSLAETSSIICEACMPTQLLSLVLSLEKSETNFLSIALFLYRTIYFIFHQTY